jgi:hypothetical protein
MKASDFYSTQGVHYDPRAGGRYSYQSIKALTLLTGHQWNDVALGFVHALRPSSIRVVRAEETCDARPGRVTVYVDANNNITSIRQECEVWLPEGIENGHDLREKLRDVSSTGDV